jgi:peptide/nickel transport system substrate-binding protein/oligopeptide transport system substrate-binding protein
MKGFQATRRLAVAGLAAIGLLVPAIGPVQATSTHAGAGVLIYPELNSSLWIRSLDPALVTDANSSYMINLLYSGLVKLDGKNNVVPDLAAAMPTISADRLTYTFKLRPNLKFSDGTPLVASDFVSSITRALSKAEGSPNALLYLGQIKGAANLNSGKTTTLAGIQAPDNNTVVITLAKPISYFLETLTYPTSDVLKPTIKAAEDLVGPSAQNNNVGTGPYMFSRPWRYRSEMYFKPNPYWYNASKLRIKEIDVPYVAADTTEYAEYQSGQLPVTEVPVSDIPTAQHLPDFHTGPYLQIDYISPNLGANATCKPLSCAPFNDLHFRRALLYAIDRNTIDNVILHGTEHPLCSLVPVGITGSDDKDLCALSPYSPTKAKAELALAKKDFGGKLPNDGNFSVVYPSGSQALSNEYVELQNEWNSVGININVTSTPLNNWYNLVSSNYTPFLTNGWIDDYPDPQDFAENLLLGSSIYNSGNFKNPQFDRLMAQADVTPNGPDRTNLYIQAQKIALQNVAYIMVGQVYGQWRWKSNLHGFYVSSSFTFYPANNDWTNASVS